MVLQENHELVQEKYKVSKPNGNDNTDVIPFVDLTILMKHGRSYNFRSRSLKRDKFAEWYQVIVTMKNIDKPMTKTEIINRSMLNFRRGENIINCMENTGLLDTNIVGKRKYYSLSELGDLILNVACIIASFIPYEEHNDII
ncbi:hypothetical protein [Thermoplasma volcanium]|nr:hypothetical protein [Thermoplasma volcanium]